MGTLGLVTLGPVLVIVTTFLLLQPLENGPDAVPLRIVLLADLIYVLVVATWCWPGWRG